MSTSSLQIIAEIGLIHDGSVGQAKCLIRAAAESGATIVKLQTHLASEETTRSAPSPPYFNHESRFEYFERTAFDLKAHGELVVYGESLGVQVASSPFSEAALDLVIDAGISLVKIGSGEVTNIPLLQRAAKKCSSIYLSSGMSTWEELDRAFAVLSADCQDVVVMQCTSQYPCLPEHVGLNLISELKRRYGCPIGFSDHTMDYYAAIVALVNGATVFEKHFTLSRQMYGPDPQHSFVPEEFARYVQELRKCEVALANNVDKDVQASVLAPMKAIFEKSVVARNHLQGGHVLTRDDLAFKKPGNGLSAARYEEILGRRLTRSLRADDLIQLADLE